MLSGLTLPEDKLYVKETEDDKGCYTHCLQLLLFVVNSDSKGNKHGWAEHFGQKFWPTLSIVYTHAFHGFDGDHPHAMSATYYCHPWILLDTHT